MSLLSLLGLHTVPQPLIGSTLVVGDAVTLKGADDFLAASQAKFGSIGLAIVGDAPYVGDYPHLTLPAKPGATRRVLRKVAPARLIMLAEANQRFDVPTMVDCATFWINAQHPQATNCGCVAVTVATPELAEGVAGALATGDPLLGISTLPATVTDEAICERFKEQRGAGRWLGYFAATGEEEEPIAYSAFFQLARRKMGFLILAPQDPARYEPVYRDALKYRLPTNRHLRLSTSYVPIKTRVYYVEDGAALTALYACADFVVAGGTLSESSNNLPDLLTPIMAGKPVIVGPAKRGHPLVRAAIGAGAALAAETEAEVVDQAHAVVSDPDAALQRARRAKAWLQLQQGALERTLDLLR